MKFSYSVELPGFLVTLCQVLLPERMEKLAALGLAQQAGAHEGFCCLVG